MSSRQSKFALPSALAVVAVCMAPVQVTGTMETPSLTGGAAAVSPVWIEYTVSGDAELQAREEDVVMCSETEDGFKAHTLGDWIITLEADGNGPGVHAVRFTVAVPDSITTLHDDNFRTDDRFYGDGTMTVESAGKDDFGFDLITAGFSGIDLQSEAEHTISVKGKLGCQVL